MPTYISQSQFQILVSHTAKPDSEKILAIGNIFFRTFKEIVCYTTNDQRHIRFAISEPIDDGKNSTHFLIFDITSQLMRIHLYFTDENIKVLPKYIGNSDFLQQQPDTQLRIINSANVAALEIYQIVGLAVLSYNSRIQL